MTVPGRAFGAIILVMLLGSSSPSEAAPVSDAATDAVERPLSPGAVALLLPHVSHPGVVLPLYPSKLVQERVQGVVMVEAIISSTGCVAEATVTRAVHPLLDASAVVAVSQWEYAPTFLNGEAVPVIMTVTVNYSLQP